MSSTTAIHDGQGQPSAAMPWRLATTTARDRAASTPRYLGLRVVLAKSFARIHLQNLINYGILPLYFVTAEDYDHIVEGD